MQVESTPVIKSEAPLLDDLLSLQNVSELIHPHEKIAKMACFNNAKQRHCIFKQYQ